MDPEDIFSDYRSEWIVNDFDDRFVEPPYYHRLLGPRPTFLIGGRGTGKTIALRSLHFSNKPPSGPARYGIYIKAFKNRVLAFSGSHLPEEQWTRAFEHYMNLLCCQELAQLCRTVFDEGPLQGDEQKAVELLCVYLSIRPPRSFSELHDLLRREIARLNRYIVAPSIETAPPLSIGEEAVVEFAKDIHSLLNIETPLYVCIDEWENLSEGQQAAMNVWIKNCAWPISYKVGVRQNGIKTRSTGGPGDPLSSPADYSDETISGDEYEPFCIRVAERRLSLAQSAGLLVSPSLASFLPQLSRTKEAELLGAASIIQNRVNELESNGCRQQATWLIERPPDEAYVAIHLSDRTQESLEEIISDAVKDPSKWRQKVGNYGYASLFTITKGRKGQTIRKIYAGQTTFRKLSGGNVRYLLELLDEVVRVHFRDSTASSDSDSIQPTAMEQTIAATAVAKRHLNQIPGLTNEGLRLARLVRSLGTAFHALLREPVISAPEQTSFVLTGTAEDVNSAKELLDEGCAILALVVERTTKKTHVTETQEDEYRLHALLCPHFAISYRRKRRIMIEARLLLDAAENVNGARALVAQMTGSEISVDQQDLLAR